MRQCLLSNKIPSFEQSALLKSARIGYKVTFGYKYPPIGTIATDNVGVPYRPS